MRIAIGYPPLADEAQMLSEQATRPAARPLEPVADGEEVLGGIEDAQRVFVEESLNRYVVALLRQTRVGQPALPRASPRAGIASCRVAKARALVSAATTSSRTT
jgi:MoxR-like ATPase